jgi:hypothetical protein
MNATLLKRWTTWLLPLIVLRAFIPIGFMLSAEPQGLMLTFCPSIVQDAGGHDEHAPADAAEDTAAGSTGSDHSSHAQADNAPCPYGLVAAAASVEPGEAAFAELTTDESSALPAVPSITRSPTHRLRIRGPPAISPKALI